VEVESAEAFDLCPLSLELGVEILVRDVCVQSLSSPRKRLSSDPSCALGETDLDGSNESQRRPYHRAHTLPMWAKRTAHFFVDASAAHAHTARVGGPTHRHESAAIFWRGESPMPDGRAAAPSPRAERGGAAIRPGR
jgi:hypothetical protein